MSPTRRALLAAAIFAALMALVAGVYLVGAWTRTAPPNAPAVTLIVPRGASLPEVARQLEEARLVPDAGLFRLAARLLGPGRPIRYGEYAFRRESGWAEILRMLQDGQVVRHLFTLPEGQPSILVHERLTAEPLLTGSIPVPAEGSLLPDTYAFERGESRAAVVRRMQGAMQATLARLWARRRPTTAAATPAEAVILASIVEKETGLPSERRMVAGVYTNRLKRGMKLDADPTVIYPVTRGRPLGRRILRSELLDDNGYNTYARPGLPAGPIANPGRASLEAVLDPAETDALYFVADGRGGHVFAATLAEHQANVVRWRAVRRARGEL